MNNEELMWNIGEHIAIPYGMWKTTIPKQIEDLNPETALITQVIDAKGNYVKLLHNRSWYDVEKSPSTFKVEGIAARIHKAQGNFQYISAQHEARVGDWIQISKVNKTKGIILEIVNVINTSTGSSKVVSEMEYLVYFPGLFNQRWYRLGSLGPSIEMKYGLRCFILEVESLSPLTDQSWKHIRASEVSYREAPEVGDNILIDTELYTSDIPIHKENITWKMATVLSIDVIVNEQGGSTYRVGTDKRNEPYLFERFSPPLDLNVLAKTMNIPLTEKLNKVFVLIN